MQQAEFDGKGSCIRWTETPGAEPACVYVHGLGSVSTVYHAHIAARPARFGYTLIEGREGLEAAGVRVVSVSGAGRNVMFDRPDAFAAAVTGQV